MDKSIRRIIYARQKEKRTAIFKLPNLWGTLLIAVVTIVLLWGSYLLKDYNEWASNILISAGCGSFTGLAFYFLSNLRNNKLVKLQKEYQTIKNTIDIMKEITFYGDFYKLYIKLDPQKRNPFEDGQRIVQLLYDLDISRSKIPLTIYDTIHSLGFDPIDRDNISSYRDGINTATTEIDIKRQIIRIRNELIPAMDRLSEILQEKDDQLVFAGSHFI